MTARPTRGLPVGSTPLVDADRLGPTLGIDRLWLKDDTRNPTLSFKDRAVAIAAARAVEFGLETLACASTGNLAGATAAAAAAIGLPAYVFVPADLEPAKIDHALAYGATVVPVDGTYDDVNRLCLEVADELGWGFVNVNLRPFYAEGSKTLAFEIAEELGWRLPDVIVAPIASGAMFTKLAKGFDELVAVGLIERTPVRFVGGQAAGCAPVATAFAAGQRRHRAGPGRRTRSSARWRSATRPTAATRSSWPARAAARSRRSRTRRPPRRSGGSPRSRGSTRRRPAGSRSPPPRRPAGAGVIRAGDEVVALLTGNGLKTPDAIRFGSRGSAETPAGPGRPGLAPTIPARFAAFEAWLDGMSDVRIPPVLRTSTGGQKQVEVAGATVGEVIGGLVAAYPGLAPQLLAGDGDLNRFVNVFLNDTDVRHLQALDTPVGERDTVLLLPAMAGGAIAPRPEHPAG